MKYNVRQAEEIDKLLEAEDISGDLKHTLLLVQDIKRYSVRCIGLNHDKNYSRYVELDKNYLVDVVSACKKDAFKPYIWKYLFFGSFPYKGFFKREDALREAEKLKKKDLDVLIRKVDAFSTLGFFVDPVYSFMNDYSVFALASLIIHEQTHSTLFIKNEIQFNEELATFIGREGALNYIKDRYGVESKHYRKALDYIDDWDRYSTLIRVLYDELNALYESGKSREYILDMREDIFDTFKGKFSNEYSLEFKTESFRSIQDIPLHNAYIISFVRYTQDLNIFYELYRDQGYDLNKTFLLIMQVEKERGDPKAYIRKLIDSHE